MDCGGIKPLCDLLSTPDVRIVTVALEGLENILKVSRGTLSPHTGCGHTAACCMAAAERSECLPACR